MVQQTHSWVFVQMNGNLCAHKTLHTNVVAALYLIAKTWKPPRCPSIGEWINRLWYIHTVEYYSVINRSELSSHLRMNLKCTVPREKTKETQYEKATHHMILTIWHLERKKKNFKEYKKMSGCQWFRVKAGGINRWSTEDF